MANVMLLALSLFLVSGIAIADDNSKLGIEIFEYAKSMGFKTNDPNEKDDFGYTKVMYFLEKGEYEYAEYLVKHGYDLKIKNNRGETAYDYALRMGSTPEQVKMFKPAGLVSLYEETQSEKNLKHRTEQDVTKYFLSRLEKEHCSAPYGKRIFHFDLNKDGYKDLVWIYSIANCDGNQGSINITVFNGEKDSLYSEGVSQMLDDVSDVNYKTMKLKNNKLYFTENYQKPDDPNCCPSGVRKRIYSLEKFSFVK